MPCILALDTSTEACSCALNLDGNIQEHYAVIPRQHAQSILPMIRSLLDANSMQFSDLDAIAFGRGPGSFTGLRIAAGVTQGIAFAAGLPVLPVSTLAALALDVHEKTGSCHVLACLDARIDEVYWAACVVSADSVRFLQDEQLCKPELMSTDFLNEPDADGELTAAGTGLSYLERFPLALSSRFVREFPDLLPRAGIIAKLAARDFAAGILQAPEQAAPLYLRDKVTR